MATDTRIPALLSDDARDGTPERPDELGRQTFTGHLTGLLDNVRIQSDSSVLALIGDWGSGKTTVLQLLTKKLDPTTWLVGTFNPWSYPDTAALQRGFFAELASTLPKDTRASNARAKIGALARTLSPLGALGSIVGVNAEGTLRLAADLIAGDTSTTAAKNAADHALRATGRPILMIIDDLDRLTPDELLEVLKLVRLVGRLPHVYYLLSYDEHTLLDVLQRTPIAGDNQDRARAYLEKIVQVRLDMPALRDTQRSELLNRGLHTILTTCDVMLADADTRRLTWIYGAVLDQRLTTPRAINRFLGQVHAFYPPLHDEVDFVDFFLVTWLRTQEPGIYTMLQHYRDDLLAQSLSTWTFSSRNKKDAEARRELWQTRLDAARVSALHQPGVIRVLSDLFPEIKAAFTSANHYATAVARTTPRAISDPDYYDRYVSFAVPDDDLSDTLVRTALHHLNTTPDSPELQRLASELRVSTHRATNKIQAVREARTSIDEPQLVTLFADAWATVDDSRRELFTPPRSRLEQAATLSLLATDPTTAITTIRQLAQDDEHAPFVVNVVQHLHHDQSSPYGTTVPDTYDLAPLRHIASDAIRRRNDRAPAASPFDHPAMDTFWVWEEIDPDAAHSWLRAQVDAGTWTLHDTLGALTSTATAVGTNGTRTGIGAFQLATAEETFGLDRLARDLTTELADIEPFTGDHFHIPPTPDNRTRYAIAELRKAIDGRQDHGTDASRQT